MPQGTDILRDLRLLRLGAIAIAALAFWLLFGAVNKINSAIEQNTVERERQLLLTELVSAVELLDEKTAEAVRLAASTGEQKYRDTYQNSIRKLDRSLDMLATALETDRQSLRLDKPQHDRLRKLENRVFELIADGDSDAARQLAFGDAYIELTDQFSGIYISYVSAVQQLAADAGEASAATLQQAIRSAIGLVLLFIVSLVGGLAIVSRQNRKIRESRQEILRREQLQALYLETIPVAIIIASEKREIIFENYVAREMFSNRTAEYIATTSESSRGIFANSNEDGEPEPVDLIAEALQKGTIGHDNLFFYRGDWPEPIYAQCIGKVAEPTDTGDRSIILAISDITSQIRIAERLRHVLEESELNRQSKERFFAALTHDLKTPLTAIIGNAGMLEFDASNSELPDFVDYGKTIKRSGERLLKLIEEIMEVSRAQSGRLELDIAELDLPSFLSELVSQLEAVTSINNNQLSVDVDDDVGSIHTDEHRLHQILSNLVSNAAKFTSDGTITIKAANVESGIRIAVRDTGIGMTSEELERAFEAYTQASSSTARKFGGTGLGLTICRELTGKLGSVLQATSAPGEGTEFYFVLKDLQSQS